MVERYQSQVRQGSLPNAYMRNHVDGAATGVQVAGAIQQGGEEIRKFAMVQQRRQDEWDAARVMEAQTEYNRVLSDRMDNPEEGFTNTRKLGAARGVTEELDKYGDEMAARIADTLDNDAQRGAFLRVAQRAKIPYWKQASEFEARQVKTYRDQIFKTTLDQGGMSVQRAPLDAVAFAAAAEQGANAIRSQFYGADESVINAAIGEYTSGLEQQRIAIVASEDPILAGRMIEDSQYLTPEAASKLKSAIAPQVELVQTQEYVDQLVTEFGPDREQEGIAHIRETSSGRDEEKRVSAYKTRINEMKVREGNADADLRKLQKENYDAYQKEYFFNGRVPSSAQVEQDVNSGRISMDQGRTLLSWSEVAATRSDITKNLAKIDPNWNNMTAEEQESKVMRAAGKTPEQRAAVLERIKAGVLDGSVTDADLDAEYNNMNITRAERDYYRSMDTKFGKEQKDFVAQQKRDLITDIATINIPGKNGAMYRSIAQSVFTDKVAQLDPQSKTYRMDVMDARRAAVVAAVEASGKDLEKNSRAPWSWNEPYKTPFGQRVGDTLASLEEATGNVQEYRPEMYESKVDLTPRPEEGPAYKKSTPAGSRAPATLPASAPAGMKNVHANHGQTILQASAEHNVPVNLIYGIIQAESNGNPGARSKAGAMGLMQLMPGTASGLGVSDAYDPGQNIRGGVKYFGQLLKKYNGNVEHALRAYNWGPGSMDAYLRGEKKKMPKETQEYVGRVLSAAARYGNAGSPPAPETKPTQQTSVRQSKAAPQVVPPAPMQERIGPTREAAASQPQGRAGPTLENEAALKGRPTLKSILDGE